jgi:exodeoxyribonuclease V gamma subunit
MLKIYHSNRLEILFECLVKVVRQPLASLTSEVIIVQSQGMARWLSLEMARGQGICTNHEFPFPAAFIWRLYRAIDDTLADISPFEGGPLVWALMGRLPRLLSDPGFEPLRDYLAAEMKPGRRLYQLACRIARTFEHYVAFRPDWVRDWEAGLETHWQAKTWRQLRRDITGRHRADLLFELLAGLDRSVIKRAAVPDRISLFGIPALPLTQFEVFARLADHIDVHLFLLNPCQTYWDEIVTKRDLARISLTNISTLDPEAEMHFDPGNSLLASFGKQGRDFQRIIHQYDYEEIHHFDDPGNRHLLATLQSDILHGRDRGPEDEKFAIGPDDCSIQFHVAHSPLREVEVLHDRLLDLLNNRQDISPGDVLVMTPDIGLYAPYIEAVFSCPEDENLRIPFSIADRSAGNNSLAIKAFLDLLRITPGRLSASEVLGLLDYEPVRLCFRLTRQDVETVRGWVRDTAIYWGEDQNHRARLGLPATKEGTWKNGLERLLLGYALPGGMRRFFRDILPYDGIEGSSGELLGQFVLFLEELFGLAADLNRSESLTWWAGRLLAMLGQFFASHEVIAQDLQLIRTILDGLDRDATFVDYREPVTIEVVRTHLQSAFLRQGRPGNFLTGETTFCQMVPMRSIPFKVICLLGMDDGAFPRLDRPPGFDLMAREYRIGDRLRREDDRYLFLEALLSARDSLYLSYVGAGIRNNKELPPSPLLDELLDYIGQACHMASRDAKARFVTFHPLQPFSQRYFTGDERLFSYSQTNRVIAAARSDSVYSRRSFFPPPVPWTQEEAQQVDIYDFIRFFTNPTKYLLRTRFELYLEDRDGAAVDRERFSLSHLERYQLACSMIDRELAGDEQGASLAVYRALGELPPGAYGIMAYEEQAALAHDFSTRLVNAMGSVIPEPLEVDLDCGPLHLTGWLETRAGVQYLFRPARCEQLSFHDTVRHWLLHLLLNAVPEGPAMKRSIYVCRDGRVIYEPIVGAREYLVELGEWYRRGQDRPLPLFPRASYAYGLQLWQEKTGRTALSSLDQARERAAQVWHDGEYLGGGQRMPEKNDPYFRLAFGDDDPLATVDFHGVAATLLQPAILARRTVLED